MPERCQFNSAVTLKVGVCGVVVSAGNVKLFKPVIALQQLGNILSLCFVRYNKKNAGVVSIHLNPGLKGKESMESSVRVFYILFYISHSTPLLSCELKRFDWVTISNV